MNTKKTVLAIPLMLSAFAYGLSAQGPTVTFSISNPDHTLTVTNTSSLNLQTFEVRISDGAYASVDYVGFHSNGDPIVPANSTVNLVNIFLGSPLDNETVQIVTTDALIWAGQNSPFTALRDMALKLVKKFNVGAALRAISPLPALVHPNACVVTVPETAHGYLDGFPVVCQSAGVGTDKWCWSSANMTGGFQDVLTNIAITERCSSNFTTNFTTQMEISSACPSGEISSLSIPHYIGNTIVAVESDGSLAFVPSGYEEPGMEWIIGQARPKVWGSRGGPCN